jgi:hydrogenase nickel incorporation protein HypB
MCITCGCSDDAQPTYTRPDLQNGHVHPHRHLHSHSHTHLLEDGTTITHDHPTHPNHSHSHPSADPAGLVVPVPPNYPVTPASTSPIQSPSPAATHAHAHGTTLTLEQNLLAKNDSIAGQNRSWLGERSITALNLVSSPGAGKTTLLVRTIEDLKGAIPITVIEGDQETAHDAERIAATGCSAIQVNTGTGCHLEAAMVKRGLDILNPPNHSLVMIENVGNLVCPALFDLGEKAKVAILSVTEGEDKPIKYPHMFRASRVMMLTKIDLLPYINFDVQRCLDYARQVNPNLILFQVSATTGEGLQDWYDWLRSL